MDEPGGSDGHQPIANTSGECESLNLDKVRRTPGYLMRRAHQFANAAYAAEFGPDVVTGVQFVALTAASEEPGLTAQMIAERIGYDKMTTSQVIRRMVDKKLIERHPSQSDGREMQIWLTDAGREAIHDVSTRLDGVGDQVLAPLDPEEKTTLIRLLQKLDKAARKK